MANEFEVLGQSDDALFTLKVYRGEGMALLAMNWKTGQPSDDFVGFGIEYQEPGGDRFFSLNNRLSFTEPVAGATPPATLPTLQSPIQKFRWVHFPRNAELPGLFVYRVTPVFMNDRDELSYGLAQTAALELRRETYPGQLNVSFTRGFVSSQAFVDLFGGTEKDVSTLLPKNAAAGLDFVPTHPDAETALAWMGFEARSTILETLTNAVAGTAPVRVIAYDLNEPHVVAMLQQLGSRLTIIIDNSGDHGKTGSAENEAATRLTVSAGADHVKRQHMGGLQHNKVIIVEDPATPRVVCGSTNFSWRGFYIQANNAVILDHTEQVDLFKTAFDDFWASDNAAVFGSTTAAVWQDLGIDDVSGTVAFSPHSTTNALLAATAADIASTTSSLFYSLAFLYQTTGPIRDAIEKVTADDSIFVYGMSDRKLGGLDVQKPDGNVAPVYPAALSKDVPPPFSAEPTGGSGIRMHHKFVVIDFNTPNARVYFGSYNFSDQADTKNGENLLLVKDQRIAVSYLVEAIRLFDHYHFRIAQNNAAKTSTPFVLTKPPRAPGDVAWWVEDYTVPVKIRDRELFA